jgi:glycosyltransferase involved in cell wall biosynthesis
MYETIAELIVAQNKQGIESYLFDPANPAGGLSDDKITTVNHAKAMEADIYCISSILPTEFWNLKPTLFIAHGMPEAVMMHEMVYDGIQGFSLEEKTHALDSGKDGKKIHVGSNLSFNKEFPFSTYIAYMKNLKTIKGTVTFWKRHQEIWKPFNRDLICEYVPGGVDLDHYTPLGEKERLPGEFNGIYAEMYRYVKHPLFVYCAMAKVHETNPGLRLYGFGCKEGQIQLWSNILSQTGWHNFAPKFGNLHSHIEKIYRGNDFLLSPCPDSSRVSKEALACGMPVISKCDEFTDYVMTDDIQNIADTVEKMINDLKDDTIKVRKNARKIAEDNFDINNTAKGMIKIYNNIAGG